MFETGENNKNTYAIITWYAKDKITADSKVKIEIKPLGFPNKNNKSNYSRCNPVQCKIWHDLPYMSLVKVGTDLDPDYEIYDDYKYGLFAKTGGSTIIAVRDSSEFKKLDPPHQMCACQDGKDNEEYCHIDKDGKICRNWTWTSISPWIMYEDVNLNFNPEVSGEYVLDYNILERKIWFDLGTSSTSLSFPNLGELTRNFSWVTGSGAGSLGIRNDTPEVFGETFYAENASVEDKNPPSISISPTVHTLLDRKNYGDYPPDRIYGVSKEMIGQVSSGGELDVDPGGAASGDFTYEYGVIVGYNEETGTPIIQWYPDDGSASKSFGRRIYRKSVAAKVYNSLSSGALDGKAQMATYLDKRIDNYNSGKNFKQELYWVSMENSENPIKFDVVRLMYFQEEDNSLTNETVVEGRYKRYFKWQNEAILTAKSSADFEEQYNPDRDEARKRNYRYIPKKAVFASDLSLNDKSYPIRSGYYFNPAGIYEFTIKTKIYKKGDNGSTQEHKDLVNAMIGAFRYESEMVYINPSTKKAVSIKGIEVDREVTTYTPVLDKTLNRISVKYYPEFLGDYFFDVDDTDYRILPETREVNHLYPYPSFYAGEGYRDSELAATDPKFRRNMEGYDGSGTDSNRFAYRYAEFVEKNVKIFEVHEKTTVKITVNPKNNKVYTHAQMKNGRYYIRAFIGEVKLSAPAYEQLSNINENGDIFVIDDLGIDVVGSIYDDPR
jgi:hypothetical protein